jgi:hypothetical protein
MNTFSWSGALLWSLVSLVACAGKPTDAGVAPASGGTGGVAAAGGGEPSAGADGLALGEPCVLAEEQMPNLSGFQVSETNVETRSTACASGICLGNHFQGRASCPYGQPATGGDCTLPGSSTPVTVQVRPQLKERPANRVVTCSCHCDGAGPGPYCTCPEGMDCAELVPKLLSDPDDLSGSYCILKGTQYEAGGGATPCDASAMDCGDAHPY